MSKNVESKAPSKAKPIAKPVHIVTAKDLSVGKTERTFASDNAFAIYIHSLRQNWRQGTVSVKARADVSRSGRKPWRQKGTGRARAGTARSPLWRGGGVIHGPQPRTRGAKLSKKVKRGVLQSLFWECLDRGAIIQLNELALGDAPKTAVAYKALKDAGLCDKKVALFLRHDDILHQASFANIENVRTLFFDQANAYDLAVGAVWVVLEKDFNLFKEMVETWLSN